MKLKYRLLILCIAFLFVEHGAFAQAIIGSDTTPKEFAVLEVAGVGGVKLPALTLAERDLLTVNSADAKASGLVIYNTTDSCFQFWTGTLWASLKSVPSLNPATNGITGSQAFVLGGNMVEDTKINQNGYNLFFDITSGTFSIQNETTFVVKTSGVGIGTSTPTAALDVNVAANPSAGFKYTYPGADMTAGNALLSDNLGNAHWGTLAPEPSLIAGEIIDQTLISTLNAEVPKQISQPLHLDKGIYMIVARYLGMSSSGDGSGYGFNSWLRLREVNNPTVDIAIVGQVPQLSSNQIVTTPQLVYIVKVLEGGADYVLWGDLMSSTATGAANNTKIILNNTTYGQSYFRAIRLSK